MSSRRFACSIAVALLALAPAALAGDKKPPATVAPTPNGKLNREEFEEALKPHLKEMHDCYEKALKKDALAEGEVVLAITTQGGKVLVGDTDREASTLKLEDAHKCIIAIVKKMKMPLAKNDKGEHDPKAIAAIKYPVDFSLGIDVESGASAITGAKLDYNKVKNVFFVRKIDIGRCYLDAYKAKKGEAAIGKLVLKVAVTGGAVTTVDEVSPDTTVADTTLKKCVFDEVKTFKFPLAKDAKGNDDAKAASVITYPIEFKPM